MEIQTDPRSSIELDLLRTQPLKNEEIIELTAFICQAESIDPFIDHIVTLRDRYDMTIEIRPLEIEILSLRDKFPLRSLRNFFIAISDVGYHGLVMQVITLYQYDLSAAVYLLNLETVFGTQPDESFVRDTLRVVENSDMEGPGINATIHLFQGKLRKISEYAPIPEYIRNFDINIDQLPKLQESEISEEVTPEIIAQYIQERLENMGQYLDVPEGKTSQEVLIEMVNNLDPSQYDELIGKMTIDPEDVGRIKENKNIFRVYGPVNSYPDTDFSELMTEEGEYDVNLIFGGARMFTDLSQEVDPETSVSLDEWFTGSCMQCFRRIRSYHYAVREPGLLGGWSGCFCSWECVRGSISDGQSAYDFEGDINDPSKLNMYAIKLALTIQIENEMLDIGIAEREEEEETCPEEEEIDTIRSEQLEQDLVESLQRNIESLSITSIQSPAVKLPGSI